MQPRTPTAENVDAAEDQLSSSLAKMGPERFQLIWLASHHPIDQIGHIDKEQILRGKQAERENTRQKGDQGAKAEKY